MDKEIKKLKEAMKVLIEIVEHDRPKLDLSNFKKLISDNRAITKEDKESEGARDMRFWGRNRK